MSRDEVSSTTPPSLALGLSPMPSSLAPQTDTLHTQGGPPEHIGMRTWKGTSASSLGRKVLY